ncbi:MAG: hypothetical protein OEY29_10835 [Gammaproteobacteria bacterium]|nr:hypothetical protein [Gammaproteobacteria bacterium]
MKFYALLTVLSLTFASGAVYAADEMKTDDESFSYCSEEAQREGIENEGDKIQFINECIDSFNPPLTESGAAEK